MPGSEHCSFCGKPKNEVANLIAGGSSGIFICNGCVEMSHTALVEVQLQKAKEADADKPLPKPLELLALLNEYVIGQETAQKIVATAVYNHYKRRRAIREGFKFDVEIQKSNILIGGPSGCGKTQIARTIARILNVPFYVQDATKLTQAGYVGEDVDVVIQGLIEKAKGNVEQAQWGIVVIDEIDKLARKSGRDASAYRDVSGEGVQQALLKLVEGGEITIAKSKGSRLIDPMLQETVTVDTTNILFICMGSFNGIKDVIQRRVNSKVRVGFGGTQKEEVNEAEIYGDLNEDDILEFGIIPELAGRLPVLTSVLKLTEEELVRVLLEPKDSLVKQFKALFRMDDIDLQFEDKALKAIARKAATRETGARALRGIIEKLLLPHSLTAPSDPEIEAIRITEDYVEGKVAEPIIVKGKKKSPPPLQVAEG